MNDKLKYRLKDLGISQKEIASILGITQSAVSEKIHIVNDHNSLSDSYVKITFNYSNVRAINKNIIMLLD